MSAPMLFTIPPDANLWPLPRLRTFEAGERGWVLRAGRWAMVQRRTSDNWTAPDFRGLLGWRLYFVDAADEWYGASEGSTMPLAKLLARLLAHDCATVAEAGWALALARVEEFGRVRVRPYRLTVQRVVEHEIVVMAESAREARRIVDHDLEGHFGAGEPYEADWCIDEVEPSQDAAELVALDGHLVPSRAALPVLVATAHETGR